MKRLIYITAAVTGAVSIAYAIRRAMRQNQGWDKEFTGAFPRASGAISAVTGGPPEDMNEMPASPMEENPVYDGSELERVLH